MLFINKRTGTILRPANKYVEGLYNESPMYEVYKPGKVAKTVAPAETTAPDTAAEAVEDKSKSKKK